MIRDIQTEILTKLLRTTALRYKDVRPEGVTNDLYNYHLQFLVGKGLIRKDNQKYSLTEKGKRFVADLEPLSPLGRKADRFKINVLTIIYRKNGKEIEVLNQTRKRQAFYNRKGVMGGTVRRGENMLEAARRKLKEETGLEAVGFKLLGMVRKIDLYHGEIFSDILFFICASDQFRGLLSPKTDFGENYWVPIHTAIKNEQEAGGPIKKVVSLLKLLKKEKMFKKLPFFYEEEVQSITNF